MCKRIVNNCKKIYEKIKDYFDKNQSQKKTPRTDKAISLSPPDDQVEKLLNKLDKELSEYEKGLLAYKVGIEANKQRVPLKVEDKLISKYGEILGKPVLELEKIFTTKSDRRIFSEVEKQWLSRKNVTYINGRAPGFQIEEMLDESTNNKALEIVKKALINESKVKNKVYNKNSHLPGE